jgi:hypothetical protein
MTGLNVPTAETLRPEKIADLAGAQAPCVTILLPAYRPGAQAKSMGVMLRTYSQDVERQLNARRVAQSQITDFVEPLLRLADAPEFHAGSHRGRAIFRSPEVFTVLNGIEPLKPALTVAGSFELRAVLSELNQPAEFFILRLSQKAVELWRCAGLEAKPIELPKGVPRTLDEALEFKPPDHDLENRSSAGASVGNMPGVRFGTGSDRERSHAYLADFYRAVDRGVRELGRGGDAPLVLAGVDEDTSLYRSVSDYPTLLTETIHGSATAPMSPDELFTRGYSIVRSGSTGRAVAGLMEMKERMAPTRFSANLDTILHAASDGRVGWIYLNQDARVFGVFDRAQQERGRDWGEEDLLNLAAVETLRHGGSVFSLPADKMPDNAAVAAIFRY